MKHDMENTSGSLPKDQLQRYLRVILRRVLRTRCEKEELPLAWLLGSDFAGRQGNPDIDILGQELAAAIRLAPADTWLRAFQRPQPETDQEQRGDGTYRANAGPAP
jgi:hypothetical protein